MEYKLLINDTIRITESHADIWLKWMKQIVFPMVQKSPLIESYRLTRIKGDEANDGISFACQYICPDSVTYSNFINNFDPKIQQEQMNRFKGHFATFRSVLEIIEEGQMKSYFRIKRSNY